jgi:ABC-2 type transport system permease protein
LYADAPSAKKGFLESTSRSVATLFERRWLIWHFMLREFSRSHRGTYLGILWLVLEPLLMVILYTLVFSEIIGLKFREGGSVANYGLYVYCGIIPFQAYSKAASSSLSIIRRNKTLVEKVVFPLEILPLNMGAVAVVNQVFGFGVLIPLVALLEGQLHWTVLLLPLMMVPQLLFVMGLCYLGAVVGTNLPDVRGAIRSVVRISFWVTPVIWPPDTIPENLSFLVDYNPVAFFVLGYRALILEGHWPQGMQTLWFTLFAGALCAVGFVVFVRTKKRFADLI